MNAVLSCVVTCLASNNNRHKKNPFSKNQVFFEHNAQTGQTLFFFLLSFQQKLMQKEQFDANHQASQRESRMFQQHSFFVCQILIDRHIEKYTKKYKSRKDPNGVSPSNPWRDEIPWNAPNNVLQVGKRDKSKYKTTSLNLECSHEHQHQTKKDSSVRNKRKTGSDVEIEQLRLSGRFERKKHICLHQRGTHKRSGPYKKQRNQGANRHETKRNEGRQKRPGNENRDAKPQKAAYDIHPKQKGTCLEANHV